jgi:hypothetical protein
VCLLLAPLPPARGNPSGQAARHTALPSSPAQHPSTHLLTACLLHLLSPQPLNHLLTACLLLLLSPQPLNHLLTACPSSCQFIYPRSHPPTYGPSAGPRHHSRQQVGIQQRLDDALRGAQRGGSRQYGSMEAVQRCREGWYNICTHPHPHPHPHPQYSSWYVSTTTQCQWCRHCCHQESTPPPAAPPTHTTHHVKSAKGAPTRQHQRCAAKGVAGLPQKRHLLVDRHV